MHLQPGSKLGPYEVLAPLGAGGMGEVYRARDTRLGRDVAIKVLPAERLLDESRRRRFVQEARSASALNHPNIVTIYEIESADGIDFIVMEYVAGKTLGDLIRPGMPLAEILRIAIPIADALARAHAAGIIHRDLKPANVVVSPEGVVKILDFGLAKLVSPDASSSTADTQTQESSLSGVGGVIGTPGYMSPEQATGGRVDSRTDVFAFGALLYELVTGRRAFAGGSSAETLAAVVRDEPVAPSKLRTLPRELERLILRCLKKEPERRFQHMGDVKVELQEIKEESDSQPVAAAAPARSRHTLWAAMSLAVALAAVAAALLLRPAASPAPIARLAIALPDDAGPDPGRLMGEPGISPDGTTVVTTLGTGARTYLALRRLDSERFERLPGTDGGQQAFWSPDGRHIAFFAEGKLKRLAVNGGEPRTLCEVSASRGGAWSPSGTIIIGTNYGKGFGILRVSDAGGQPVPVTQLDQALGENSHRYPVFLPDGKRFVYFARTRADENRAVYLASLDGGEPRKRLVVSDSSVAVARDPASGLDYLLYPKDGKLWAQPLDGDRGELRGDPLAISEDLGLFSVSLTGTLVSRRISVEESQLTWFDRSGKALGSLGAADDYWATELSPDERWIAVVLHKSLSGYFAVWLVDPVRNVSTPFSQQTERSTSPAWSRDGKRIYFASPSRGSRLFSKAVDQAGEEQVVATPGKIILPRDVSPDGRILLADLREEGELRRTVVYSPLGKDEWRPLVGSRHREEYGQFSPDGKWVAFQSTESGSPEIWVTDFPAARQKHRISDRGGREPRWRRDGKELFYVDAAHQMTAASVGGDFTGVRSSVLFRIGTFPTSDGTHYAVNNDGQRFLVQAGKPDATRTLHVLFNWPRLLREPAR